MGKYLTIKGADFSNVAIHTIVDSSKYVFITRRTFQHNAGIMDADPTYYNANNALMVVPASKSHEPYPIKGKYDEYTLISVPKNARGVKITTVDNGAGLWHGVNLESAENEDNTNALGWTRFSDSVNGSTYMFSENFYSNGYKWLKCAFKKDGALVEDGDINADNFKIKFLF